MRSWLALAICTIAPSFGQFSSLSTDYAGQRAFFTTELSQIGSGQPDYGKLFLADDRGVTPFLIRTPEVSLVEPPYSYGRSFTNWYQLDGVDVASNGAFLSVVGLRKCDGSGGFCHYAASTDLYNVRGEVVLQAPGRLVLSPNAKWALGVAAPLYGGETHFTLYNLTTLSAGSRKLLDIPNKGWRLHDIADDGTAVIAMSSELLLVRGDQEVGILRSGLERASTRAATIDSSGSVVVWEQDDSQGRSLFSARIADGLRPVTLRVTGRNDFQPCLSDDGRRILFLSAPHAGGDQQAFVMNVDGTERRQVSAEVEGVAVAALSGSGTVAWLVTRTGQLISLDLSSGHRRVYTDPLAAFLRPVYLDNLQVAPSLLATVGEVVTLPASVMAGESVRLTIGGKSVPVLRVGTQSVTFQVPWSAGFDSWIAISKPDWPSWSGNAMQLLVSPVSPRMRTAIHENFDAAISTERPARPGEVIHVYATGFGQVSPVVPDGEPAPTSPLARTVEPVLCEVQGPAGGAVTAETLFAGLAPGLMGIYQLDIRLPRALPIPVARIACASTGFGQFSPSLELPTAP